MDGDGDMTVLEKVAGIADWGQLHLNHHAGTYPRSTVWSMGVSVHWLDLTGDTQQVSFDGKRNTSSNRGTLAFQPAATGSPCGTAQMAGLRATLTPITRTLSGSPQSMTEQRNENFS